MTAAGESESVSAELYRRTHVAGRAAGGRHVTLPRVIHHHAVGVEAPAERADGALHAPDPPAGQAVAIALVVERNYFVMQGTVEVFTVARIVNVHVRMRAAGADGESVEAIVGFGPPAIEHGKIQTAVENDLLTAGA